MDMTDIKVYFFSESEFCISDQCHLVNFLTVINLIDSASFLIPGTVVLQYWS